MFVKGSMLLSLEDAKSEIVRPSHSILVPVTFHVCAIEPIKLALVVVSLELSPVLINRGDCRRTSDSDYCSRSATRNLGVLRIVKTSNKVGEVFYTQISQDQFSDEERRKTQWAGRKYEDCFNGLDGLDGVNVGATLSNANRLFFGFIPSCSPTTSSVSFTLR